MAYVVTAKWTAKPGEEDAVAQAIRQLIGPSQAEPAMLHYQAHRDPEDPRVFFFYEQYTDQAGYEAHAASEHFQAHGFGDAIPRLESRERAFYETWDG
ncbi:antibiotic biosynthesis monooxygenase [Baekduia soli]|uniref:Antibiotic biosynthesis monooxygenase n=1 Tax=Baekduia soli TaxID=496014 RepID=A0A5B8U4W3_9ACTN|nr:putative quinol monooxygenase [Baekduia soli]QEC47981.1 antibiotic biosynthesis monooxygenase [Baekduia soli]